MYNDLQQKQMDCDEPHLAPNEKTHPIQWTERPTSELVAAGSFCPTLSSMLFWRVHYNGMNIS
jgi:hypothetical protein